MPVTCKKITPEQRTWLENYERETHFEPLHQEDIDNGSMSFLDAAKKNLVWFESWSSDAYRRASRKIPGEEY